MMGNWLLEFFFAVSKGGIARRMRVVQLNQIAISEVLTGLGTLLKGLGVELREEVNFRQLEAELLLTEKRQLTEHFRRTLNTYTAETAHWLGGYDAAGKLVSVCAARIDRLGEDNLVDHWREYWTRCYDGTDGSMRAELAEEQHAFGKEVVGDVVYLGDMWVAEEHRGKGVAELHARAALINALLRWRPKWFYAWTFRELAESGFPQRCGFNRVHPGIIWSVPPKTIAPDLCAMFARDSDIRDLVQQLRSEPLSQWNSKKSSVSQSA